MFDTEHPFFQPLWVRFVIVVIAFIWAAFEFAMGENFWGLVSGAIGSFCTWVLLITYKKPQERDGQDG